MELIDEIKECFDKAQDETIEPKGPVTVVAPEEANLPPGFLAMKSYYEQQMIVLTRRGYRHFAGSTMPTSSDKLVEHTGPIMVSMLLPLLFRSFADGVRIGHRDDQMVKMAFHYEAVDDLFENEVFAIASVRMATGFAEDAEILRFFHEYVTGGVAHLTHITGFAHQEVDPNKVWDIWMLAGQATATAVYLAGHRLGNTWRERDVLDGIEIASVDPHESD